MKIIKHSTILTALMILITAGCTDKNSQDPVIPDVSSQLIMVITENDSIDHGQLKSYERSGNEWTAKTGPIPVSIGRSGLAPGKGIHPAEDLPAKAKAEGDGKSPSGIFRLSHIMGYMPPADAADLNMPYEMISDRTECIDDATSQFYNRIVENGLVDTIDWNSSEKMWKYRGWYDWLVVVEHNTEYTTKGAGSCIFLHLRKDENDNTAGCSAIDSDDMARLIPWLNSSRKPLLVQLTRSDYDRLRNKWNLPDFW